MAERCFSNANAVAFAVKTQLHQVYITTRQRKKLIRYKRMLKLL